MPIRAITFDFWRTLFREANEQPRQLLRAEAFATRTGAVIEEVVDALDHAAEVFLQNHIAQKATLTPRDAVRIVAERVRVEVPADAELELADLFATAILRYPPEPIDGAIEAVQAAAALLPVGIISDAGLSPGSVLRVLLDRHAFTPHLKALTFSSDVGVAKPHARMFETAATALGVDPSELLHIGDLEFTDIVGAAAVNATPVLFAGDNRRYYEKTTAPHRFKNWPGFIQALPKILQT